MARTFLLVLSDFLDANGHVVRPDARRVNGTTPFEAISPPDGGDGEFLATVDADVLGTTVVAHASICLCE